MPSDDTEFADNTHPAHLKGRILEQEDRTRHKKLVRKFTTSLLVLICAVIIGGTVARIIVEAHDRGAVVLQGCVALALVLLVGLWRLYRLYLQIRTGELHLRKLHQIRREILLREDYENTGDDDEGDKSSLLAIHKRYREEILDVVHAYREESAKYRYWHNLFQGIIIVGSIATSTITTASIPLPALRWVAVGVSMVVGLAAGFTGYFKYRERSFNLQQTADAIERQYHSVELRVGRYRNKSEADAYADFASEVEYLREEQSKRQQQLEQPPDTKVDSSS